MTGIVQYAGRTFEFEYDGPSESEIADRALEIQSSRGLDLDEATAAATALLQAEKKQAVTEQVLETLKDQITPEEDLRAETGISQRLLDKPADAEGKTELHPDNDTGDENSRVKTNDAVRSGVTELVSFLNHRLYEKRSNRQTAIGMKGSSMGVRDADARVDIEITVPETLSMDNKGNPIGPMVHDLAMQLGGAGNPDSQYAQQMKFLDRYGHSFNPPIRELVGYTFITRPHCNLSSENLANVRDFAPLLYAPAASIGMAIRGYLDTELYATVAADRKFADILDMCPFFDGHSPFNVPLVNALRSINGYPDIALGMETTEGGFFSESQTSVTGYDRLSKGQELTLTFRDYVGSPILAMHEYWTKYMGLLQDGTMHQYTTDIEANLMGYTVSIYRFIMDPTNRFIVRWSKATGCYPKHAPSGALFNYGEGEKLVQSVNNFSIQYFAHHIGYNDPLILKEFNMLVERYAGSEIASVTGDRILAGGIMNNHVRALPYISQRTGMNELQWRLTSDYTGGTVVDDRYQFRNKPDNDFMRLNISNVN